MVGGIILPIELFSQRTLVLYLLDYANVNLLSSLHVTYKCSSTWCRVIVLNASLVMFWSL